MRDCDSIEMTNETNKKQLDDKVSNAKYTIEIPLGACTGVGLLNGLSLA